MQVLRQCHDSGLVKGEVKIHTRLNGEERPISLHINDRTLSTENYVVHFPIPAQRFWDNVIFTCANMLTFESEDAVDHWCKKYRVAKGEVKSIQEVWELAKVWYGNYLSPSWTRKSPERAREIFQQTGFTSDFWKL